MESRQVKTEAPSSIPYPSSPLGTLQGERTSAVTPGPPGRRHGLTSLPARLSSVPTLQGYSHRPPLRCSWSAGPPMSRVQPTCIHPASSILPVKDVTPGVGLELAAVLWAEGHGGGDRCPMLSGVSGSRPVEPCTSPSWADPDPDADIDTNSNRWHYLISLPNCYP